VNPGTSALLTDLYQLNMIQAYLDRGETGTAVFSCASFRRGAAS
jgi:nicotinate phosphoribosyltransferase